MRLLRVALCSGLVVVSAASLAGCSETRIISVSRRQNGTLAFYVPLCGHDRLREFRLGSVDPHDPSRITPLLALDPVGPEAATGHMVLPKEHLREVGARIELLASATTQDGWSAISPTFELAHLPVDGSVLGSPTGPHDVISVPELRQAQRESCEGWGVGDLARLFARIVLPVIAILALIAYLVFRRHRQRSDAPRHW